MLFGIFIKYFFVGTYIMFWVDILLFGKDWQRKNFFSSKSRHGIVPGLGSWWRTVICLIIPTMKSCWQQIRCYVFYLFPTQQQSTIDGRTCLLSTDPGDAQTSQLIWRLPRSFVCILLHFIDITIHLKTKKNRLLLLHHRNWSDSVTSNL